MSTIDATWTTPAADQYDSVYKITWTDGTTPVSQDNVNGGAFKVTGLTAGTMYTITVERHITEKIFMRAQTVSGNNTIQTASKLRYIC